MSEILSLLTDKNARKVAEDILVAIEEKGDKESFDFDFRVKNGVMERIPVANKDIRKALVELHGCEVPSSNTWFSFDTKLNSMLGYLKDTITKILENNSITNEEMTAIQGFIKKVVNVMNDDEELLNRLKKSLRKAVLNDGDEVVFPLKDCRLLLFEFGSKEDYGDMIKIFNYKRVNKATGNFVGERNSISKDLLDKRRSFGYERGQNTQEIYTKIIEEQRSKNNPLYAEILPQDVEVVAEAMECHIDIFADYAPLEKEELISKIVEISSHNETKAVEQ